MLEGNKTIALTLLWLRNDRLEIWNTTQKCRQFPRRGGSSSTGFQHIHGLNDNHMWMAKTFCTNLPERKKKKNQLHRFPISWVRSSSPLCYDKEHGHDMFLNNQITSVAHSTLAHGCDYVADICSWTFAWQASILSNSNLPGTMHGTPRCIKCPKWTLYFREKNKRDIPTNRLCGRVLEMKIKWHWHYKKIPALKTCTKSM